MRVSFSAPLEIFVAQVRSRVAKRLDHRDGPHPGLRRRSSAAMRVRRPRQRDSGHEPSPRRRRSRRIPPRALRDAKGSDGARRGEPVRSTHAPCPRRTPLRHCLRARGNPRQRSRLLLQRGHEAARLRVRGPGVRGGLWMFGRAGVPQRAERIWRSDGRRRGYRLLLPVTAGATCQSARPFSRAPGRTPHDARGSSGDPSLSATAPTTVEAARAGEARCSIRCSGIARRAREWQRA